MGMIWCSVDTYSETTLDVRVREDIRTMAMSPEFGGVTALGLHGSPCGVQVELP